MLNPFDGVQSQPWAIWPACLERLWQGATAKAPIEALAANRGQPLANTYTVEMRDGIAILPITGVVVRYTHFLSALGGATPRIFVAKILKSVACFELTLYRDIENSDQTIAKTARISVVNADASLCFFAEVHHSEFIGFGNCLKQY